MPEAQVQIRPLGCLFDRPSVRVDGTVVVGIALEVVRLHAQHLGIVLSANRRSLVERVAGFLHAELVGERLGQVGVRLR
jgi:hypothetical protein